MLKRMLTALIGIPLAIFLVFRHDYYPLAGALGIIALVGCYEFYEGVRRIGVKPIEWAGMLAVALFVVSSLMFDRSTITSIFPAVLTLLLILSFCNEFLRHERAPVINIGATVFGAIYVGWMISHMVALRLTGTTPGGASIGPYPVESGSCLVMITFLCTWASDTGAYFIGSAFGKTKIAPKLSPNKTVEGSIGGLAGSIIMAFAFGYFIKLPFFHCLSIGLIFGILSQIGDLSESAIKRELGIKDFSNLVPGHGGIMDRFDSIIFTAPVAYYYAVLFLQNWPK